MLCLPIMVKITTLNPMTSLFIGQVFNRFLQQPRLGGRLFMAVINQSINIGDISEA
jgi:hypothetical protein